MRNGEWGMGNGEWGIEGRVNGAGRRKKETARMNRAACILCSDLVAERGLEPLTSGL